MARARPPGTAVRPSHQLKLVGDTGIEPVTSSVSRKRSPTELIARGGGGNRTRVQGFAGPCLSHSATPPDDINPQVSGFRLNARGRLSSGRRDSNPRPSPWQGDALPTEPRPRALHRLACAPRCVAGMTLAERGNEVQTGGRRLRARRAGIPAYLGPNASLRAGNTSRSAAAGRPTHAESPERLWVGSASQAR